MVAIRLAYLHGLIYGNAAAVSGWIGHARRMLEDCGDCPEQGWLEVVLGCICADPDERERRARSAIAVGQRFASAGLEFDALAYLGKARVEKAVPEGMGLVDQAVAAVSSGLVTDPWAAGEIYCSLFHACEMAVDVKRADAWLDAIDGYVERTGRQRLDVGRLYLHQVVATLRGREGDIDVDVDRQYLGVTTGGPRGPSARPDAPAPRRDQRDA